MANRASSQAPTEPVVPPPSPEATLEERTRYLLQEIGNEAGFLEEWIVHYLAELLETSEDASVAPQARSEARTEIARTLPALWEQQIAREAVQVRAKVNYRLQQTSTLNPESERLLRPLLANPEGATNLTEAEVPDAFRALWTLEELITRYWATIASVENSENEVTSEAIQKFFHGDEEMQTLQATLARLIPDLKTADPTNLTAVTTFMNQALLTVMQTRHTLLDRVASKTRNDSWKAHRSL